MLLLVVVTPVASILLGPDEFNSSKTFKEFFIMVMLSLSEARLAFADGATIKKHIVPKINKQVLMFIIAQEYLIILRHFYQYVRFVTS